MENWARCGHVEKNHGHGHFQQELSSGGYASAYVWPKDFMEQKSIFFLCNWISISRTTD